MSRVLTSPCPACGAHVRFTGDSTVIAVCEYCSSTLLRKGQALENLGRMAELFEDHSPLQLGVRGEVDGVGFVLVGRLQYRHERGAWNEWWARLDDEGTLWLSEDNGRYVITRTLDDQDVPPFDALTPGQVLPLGGVAWTVASLTRATVVAGRGELPFVVSGADEAPVVDLRDPDGNFATLDYADFQTGPGAPGVETARATLHVGRPVTLEALKVTGLREALERAVATEAFACPNCGAAVQATLGSTKSITCPACASVIDLAAGVGRRFDFARQSRRHPPAIAIGTTGRLDGRDWTVVGYQRCRGEVDEEHFEWNEYLLHDPVEGFRFLIEDQGHWSLGRVLQRLPRVGVDSWSRPTATFEGWVHHHFAAYRTTVLYVEGEFYWEVHQGDETVNAEFIAPPQGLSRETSGNEITWTASRYLPGSDVATAFRLKGLAAPTGIGMLQPVSGGGWRRRQGWLALAAIIALVLMQIIFDLSGARRPLVEGQALVFGNPLGSEHLIDIPGRRQANLVVTTQGSITNDWYQLDVVVADRQRPGEIREAGDEVAYYEGRDADGRWSEGSRRGRVVLKLPPGQYLVRVSGERNPQGPVPSATYSIATTSRPGMLVFWLGLGLLVIFNAFGYLGAPDPERTRWRDSLYGSPPRRSARERGVAAAARPAG